MICDNRRKLYTTRVEKFMKRLGEKVLSDTIELDATFGHSVEPVYFDKRLELEYKPIKEGATWGDAWESAWFSLKGTVPAAWAGKKVVAQLDFNGEGLVFSGEGVPLQGVTNGSVFVTAGGRDIFPLFDSAVGGEEVSLWVEAAANSLFGISKEQDPPRNSPKRHGWYTGTVNKIRLAVFEPELMALSHDLFVLFNLYSALPEDSTRAIRILRGLSKVVEVFADDTANASACREVLRPLLEKQANASAITATSVGHAHIDTGWLWPVRETIRKSARTYASQIDLIERYPGYVFGASQPAHYAMVKKHYPALYEKIKQAVKAGTWEPQGGMWVEADCNVTSGESLVRQFIHGKNFFKDEFDFDVKNLWIPDVFGYSASLPQMMKRAGVDYFLTQKMSWSQFNKFPHTTFNWCGIDGSTVLTHFPPENTYNSLFNPKAMVRAEANFQEKEVLDEMMVLFGIGDGGGGPKEEILERGLRQQDLEGTPKIKFDRADAFFERIAKHADEMPTWSGELYLELHRGTLTTQSRTKRGNRMLEQALRETEYLLACGDLASYPREELDGLWKVLLLNQFHDIIPGSSINMVYEVAEREYAECLAACARIQKETAARLFAEDEQSLVLVNTLNIPFTQAVTLPEGWAGAAGAAIQTEADGTVSALVEIPAQGVVTLTRSDDTTPAEASTDLVLENDLIRYEFAENGELLKAFDKEAGKEVLSGTGNVITLYEDRPNAWDAWDVDIFYEDQALETAQASAHASLGKGAVRQGVRFELKIGVSTLTQKVFLDANSKRLDFVTEVDWQERHRMLRVAFPTTIRTDQASFDIQYGYARRNTHRNLSWDMARFEVAAHKYADLSDNGYGVALLNDCKYGYKVLENVLDLNLLRSPTYPDPEADLGHQEFTYSLLPHQGGLMASDVQTEAAQLNQPPARFTGYRQDNVSVPVQVSGDGVGLEVLKKAEKAECLVVRLVERLGCDTTATVTLADGDARLVETDLLEWNELAAPAGPAVEIPMKPFEIRTFKIV
ncbi:MAG: alpha-mannosidase [Verrucomicrobia bacterium]|jgi:alpha-mannosidase|nr:alpha-mannosidase [Verrucomicrobiota bacterium]MBT7069041.1 alpha-mannosidase [Verrucomicrobiota bacterium]MBT7699714.1 alpha-mannosidase [Verrucomicrobiota bacterium]